LFKNNKFEKFDTSSDGGFCSKLPDLIEIGINCIWDEMKSVIDYNDDDIITSKEILSLKVKQNIIEENSLIKEQIDYLVLRLHKIFNQFDNDKNGIINIEDIRYLVTNYLFPKSLRISKIYVNHFSRIHEFLILILINFLIMRKDLVKIKI